MELDTNPFENIDFEVPELTSAIIETYIPQLQTNWELGQQLADEFGNPYSRTYKLLNFPNNPYSLQVIDLGAYSSEYEGSFYYLVSQNFQEITYSSKSTKGEDSFLRWEKVTTNYRQEITYLHKQIGTLTWTQSNNTGVPIPITNPFTLPLINAGKALSFTIAVTPSNQPYELRLKSAANDAGTLVTSNQLNILDKPLIEIKIINPNNVTPISFTLTFFGEYAWRSFMPLNDEASQTLLHPINSSLTTRLKPPGLSNLPDNFWNSNPNPLIMESYASRFSSNPSWL